MNLNSFANQHVLDLVAYTPGKPIEETARELGLNPEDILKLASNENPLGPSPLAVEAMKHAAANIHIYPDGAAFNLRTALAKKHGVRFEETCVGTGSSEIIELICHALLAPDTELIAAKHSFTVYAIITKLFGATFVEAPNKEDWSHDLDAFLEAITPHTRIAFITNPTNPIGTVITQKELDRFMEKIPSHVLVCIDEAYFEFATEPIDAIKYVRENKNVLVLRTFSKVYGLAGIRVGYGIAPERICTLLHKARAPFNLNELAQVAALAALDDEEHLSQTLDCNRKGMEFYEEAFKELNLPWIPSQGNFILVQVGKGKEVFQAMLAKGVIIRAQDSYQLPEWVRITIGTPKENERCLQVLKEVLKELE